MKELSINLREFSVRAIHCIYVYIDNFYDLGCQNKFNYFAITYHNHGSYFSKFVLDQTFSWTDFIGKNEKRMSEVDMPKNLLEIIINNLISIGHYVLLLNFLVTFYTLRSLYVKEYIYSL